MEQNTSYKPTRRRVILAAIGSVLLLSPLYLPVGYYLPDGSYKIDPNIIPVFFTNLVLFGIFAYIRKDQREVNTDFGNESIPNDPTYGVAYQLRTGQIDLNKSFD